MLPRLKTDENIDIDPLTERELQVLAIAGKGYPNKAIAIQYFNLSQIAPLVFIPAFIFTLGGLWFGIRKIAPPLQKLENQAAELTRGNFHAITQPVDGILEIRNLHVELMIMA